MSITLAGRPRERFRADLLAHRETFSLSDAEYADRVLKVSLNTYKKCIQPVGSGPRSAVRPSEPGRREPVAATEVPFGIRKLGNWEIGRLGVDDFVISRIR